MIHEQVGIPVHASVGDAWTDGKSFKRVLSRGGAWENVNLGSTHPDEVNHEQQRQRAEAEQRNDGTEVSRRAGESAPGDGNNGEGTNSFVDGQENTGVTRDGTNIHGIGPDTDGGPNPNFQGGPLTQDGEPVPAGHETNNDVSSDGEPLTSTGPIEGDGENRAETEAAREGVDSGPDRVV